MNKHIIVFYRSPLNVSFAGRRSQSPRMFRRWISLLAMLLALLCTAAAQAPKTVTYKILGISVDGISPKSGTDPNAIINNAGLKIGEEITMPGDQVRQAILRLWALHIFSDVQILIDHKIENGVYLVIHVTEYPRLDKVEIVGADDISKDDILKKVSIVSGQVLTPDFIESSVEKIKALYSDEGHLLAKITTSTPATTDSTKSNKVSFVINIDEGPKVQIDRIIFNGNIAFEQGDLRGAMDDNKEKPWWGIFSHPRFDKHKLQSDEKKIVKFYRNRGYLDAEVTSDSTWYSADKKMISILINVHEGPQYFIRSVTWDGSTVYKNEELSRILVFKAG
ncbi:MAG TPA: POTRA domain-containing protein, partial [Bacteroidota bacterium]|nr:POTRA domain-containing protein [Bacteroidota bacterium]